MRFVTLIALLSGISAAQERPSPYELPAEQRTGSIKRMFVLCHSHLDIGFTRPPDEVARDYKENIDAAIRLTRENPDFRWTIESAWMLEEWLRRTDDQKLIEELGVMLREKRMGLGLAFANMHSGLMGAEESNRLVYLGEKIRRRFGLRTSLAYQNDVPGFTWAYPRVFANSGVTRLILGLNLFIGGGNNLGVSQNPFYWVGPDGSRVLTYFTYDSYVEGYRWKLSGRFPIEELEAAVPRRLAWLEKNGYKHDTYLLMASPGDNTNPEVAYSTLERIREWNRRHPELPMKMVIAEEFFDYLQRQYSADYPSASGDATGHWEIVKLRVPEAAPKMRHVSAELPAAEAASTIASLLTSEPYPKFDLAEAWYSLLSFHEHTADSGGGWPGYFSRGDVDWSNIAHYADALKGYSATEQIFRKALARIGGARRTTAADTAPVIVYNGLSWPRSGPVVVDNLPPGLREGPLELIDAATQEAVPWESAPGTKRHILFLARNLPAVGYRLYTLRKGARTGSDAAPFPVDVTWNDDGVITEMVETATKRPMVASTAGRPFGGLFISRGRGEFVLEKLPRGHVDVSETAVARRIRITREGSLLPLTEVLVYRGQSYADLRFDVNIGAIRDSQSGGTRFAVALPLGADRQLYLDGAGFVMRVPQDILPGGRAPHLTPVQFLHRQAGADWGVTLATRDTAFFRPDDLFVLSNESLRSVTRDEGTQELFRTEPRSSPVLSFRFRIGAQEEDKARWTRFGAESALPLRGQVLPGGTAAAAERSFLSLNQENAQILAFKPAEAPVGWHVVRIQETAGRSVSNLKLTCAFPIAAAQRANLVEEPQRGEVNLDRLSLTPWQTLTLLVQLAPGTDRHASTTGHAILEAVR